MTVLDPAAAVTVETSHPNAAALARRLLNFILFFTVLASSIAFIEPSPHDVLMFVLLVACFTARISFDRKLTPLFLLIMLWLVGGALSLIEVGDSDKAIQFFGTSAYLGVAAIMFACLFSDGDLVRLAILRRAYLIAALIATVAGYIGFFHLLPGSDIFLENDRVSATFKDPNVYGPFLVYPMLLLLLGLLTQRITFAGVTTITFLLGGLLLSFSRGAWIHFGVSVVVAIATIYVASPNPHMRSRIVVLGLIAAFALAILFIALSSIGSVHDMLLLRAKALQPYDVGPGGRFSLQQQALNVILDNANGLGPFEFNRLYGQQHNVYMQGFLVYGWLGGVAYVTLVLLTIVFGLRCVLMATPWQIYLVAAYAAFIGETVEGAIIDSDHWRHFFLLVGLTWGLSVANINYARRRSWGPISAMT
jgi:hypothetical protein